MLIKIFLLNFFLANSFGFYFVCNGRYAQNEIRRAIDSNIRHLMNSRRQRWEWENTPQVVISMQLSKARSFFGRNYTINRMEQDFSANFPNSSIRQLAWHLLAVRSICRDPSDFAGVNILQMTRRLLDQRWAAEDQLVPKNSWFDFALAHLALCVHGGESFHNFPLFQVMMGQNRDGSFGDHSVKVTSQVISMLACILQRLHEGDHEQPDRESSFEQKVDLVLKKALAFLKGNVRKDDLHTWIGDRYDSPYALIALTNSESYGRLSKSKCLRVVKSLARVSDHPDHDEAIAMRLLALTGKNFFDLSRPQDCNETDPIPPGYYPGRGNISFLCGNFLSKNSLPQISVKLSIQTGKSIKVGGPYNLSLNLTNIPFNSSLLEVMDQARCFTKFRFQIVWSSFGPRLTAVQGVKADTFRRQYWALIDVNRRSFLYQEVGQYRPKDGDHILIQLAIH